MSKNDRIKGLKVALAEANRDYEKLGEFATSLKRSNFDLAEALALATGELLSSQHQLDKLTPGHTYEFLVGANAALRNANSSLTKQLADSRSRLLKARAKRTSVIAAAMSLRAEKNALRDTNRSLLKQLGEQEILLSDLRSRPTAPLAH